jgi:hypothetical protein
MVNFLGSAIFTSRDFQTDERTENEIPPSEGILTSMMVNVLNLIIKLKDHVGRKYGQLRASSNKLKRIDH